MSQALWGEACLAMGREQAAIAIGIVSAKPAENFRSTLGGDFHGNRFLLNAWNRPFYLGPLTKASEGY